MARFVKTLSATSDGNPPGSATTKVNLQDLPTEILSWCFKYEFLAVDPWMPHTYKDGLKALRLTSKRLEAICAPLLIDFVRVYITSDSLDRLEAISRHPVFSKSIRTVEINISFYDAVLANDFIFFAKCCSSKLYLSLDIEERARGFPDTEDSDGEELDAIFEKAYKTEEEWRAVADDKYNNNNLTAGQTLLQKAHQEYCRQFNDQTSVKRDNEHLQRIGAALQKLGALQELVMNDRDHRRSRIEDANSEYSKEGLIKLCLTGMRWKGTYPHAETTVPPVELISDLFSALLRFSIFPTEFEISITPPNNLAVLSMLEGKLSCVSRVLHRAKKLSFIVDSWARQDSLAVDNSRPLSEISCLGNLSCAFFDTNSLQSLILKFSGYPAFHETPEISVSQILPQSRSWPRLHTLVLSHIPFHQREVMALVEKIRMVKTLEMDNMYLLSGTWADTIEVFRRLQKLEKVTCKYPKGGELGDDYHRLSRFPRKAVEEYILFKRKSRKNPLVGRYVDGFL